MLVRDSVQLALPGLLFRLKLLPLMGALDIIYVMILTSFRYSEAAAAQVYNTGHIGTHVVSIITSQLMEPLSVQPAPAYISMEYFTFKRPNRDLIFCCKFETLLEGISVL